METPKTFRVDKEKEEEKIKEFLGWRFKMKKITNWLKERRDWLWIWILVFIITTALATCSELKITYEYKTPAVIKNFLSNK